MKKFLLLTFALFLSITSFAQIQRKLFKCTLGTTTYDQVVSILANNYMYPASDVSKTYLKLEDVEYGGYVWHTVTFNFYNKVLYRVTLEGVSSSQNFSELELDLRSRYEQYKTSKGYDDDTVVISTYFLESPERNYKSATIKYEYKPFTKKKEIENKSAW